MKILSMSDLHLEFDRQYGNDICKIHDLFDNCVDYDYLILAGDIDIFPYLKRTLQKIYEITKKPIIYVVGNHEFYYYSKDEVDFMLKEINNENIIILNRGIHIDGDYVFIGATGWCDESNGEFSLENQCHLNDFRLIKNENIFQWGEEDRIFFENSLEKYKDKKIICISHNVPIPRLKNNDGLTTFFQNDWECLLFNYDIELWVCGHTHQSMRTKINECKIINNPRGYYLHDICKDFDKNLIIEV